MAIRIPRAPIPEERVGPLTSTPAASDPSGAIIGRALERVGQDISATAQNIATILQKRQAIEDDLKAQQAYLNATLMLDEFSRENERDPSVDPVENLDRQIQRPEFQAIAQGLSPRQRRLYEERLGPLVIRHKLSMRELKDKRLVDESVAVAVRLEHRVAEKAGDLTIPDADVFGLSQAERQRLEAAGKAVPPSWLDQAAEHWRSLAARGLIPQAQAEERITELTQRAAAIRARAMVLDDPFTYQVIDESLKNPAASRDPRARLLEMLKPEERAQLSNQARTLAEHLENRAFAMSERAYTLAERARKKAADEAEKTLTDHMVKGTLTQEIVDAYRATLDPDAHRRYSEAVNQLAVGGPPGQPEIIRSLRQRVWAVDVTSLAQIKALERELDAQFTSRNVPLEHYQPMKSHLQALSRAVSTEAKDDTKTFLARDHEHVKALLAQQLRTRSGFEDLDLIAEEVMGQALEELGRSSAYLGRGEEAASQWWERRKHYWLAQVDARAETLEAQLLLQIRAEPKGSDSQLALMRQLMLLRTERRRFQNALKSGQTNSAPTRR